MTTLSPEASITTSRREHWLDLDWQELADQVSGELAWDSISRALYASSASIVEIWPTAVLTPKHADDVAAVLRFCSKHKVPLTCRGAGSGVVGQSLGRGLIVDFSVHMHRIESIHADEGWARVQPGVVKDDLDAELSQWGYFWPPDPSSSPWCTVGAMVANNSGGAKSVMYGTARDYLIELDLLNAQGEPFKLRPLALDDSGELVFPDDATAIERDLAQHTLNLIRDNREVLRQHAPETSRSSSGYNFFQLLPLSAPIAGEAGVDQSFPRDLIRRSESGQFLTGSPWVLDMPRLFCGSEGTLGVLISAKVGVVPLPGAVAGASISFASDAKMAEGVVSLLKNTNPAKLELLERSFIDVAAQAEPELAAGIPDELKTMLIVEYFGDDAASCAQQVDEAIALVCEGDDAPAFAAEAAYDPSGLVKVWKIRKVASPILSRVKGDVKPVRWVEDLAVPPWKLPEFIAAFQAIVDKAGFPAALFGHAGEGNLHVNPRGNVKSAEDRQKMREVASEAFALVKRLGGVISGEHGDGTMRSPYLPEVFGDAWPLMEEVKRTWDPDWILNPLTKVIPPEEGQRDIMSDLRLGEGYERHKTDTCLDDPRILEEIEKCHGCGKCRNYCPLMEVGKEEKYSARAKANLLRAVISGKLDADDFLTDEGFKANLDLCINCSQCLTDCPTQVDIPGMAIAFRDQYRKRKSGEGLLGDMLAKPDTIGKSASWLGGLANSMMNARWARGLAERAIGLDQRRVLPEYRKSEGLAGKARLKLPPGLTLPKEVVLYPGCWAEYNDPDGEKNAAIEILHALGIQVKTPALRCCGISKITQGMRDEARADWDVNLSVLGRAVGAGAKILFSAPSCLLASKHDMPRLIESDEAKRVADAMLDIHDFLIEVFQYPEVRSQLRAMPRELKNLAYHQPCHSKVSSVGMKPMELVELIPEAGVEDLAAGCCGLSGTFGMKTSNFDLSMKIGQRVFDRVDELESDAVFTPCGVCQTQLRQGNPDTKVVHPLFLLYTALPDLS